MNHQLPEPKTWADNARPVFRSWTASANISPPDSFDAAMAVVLQPTKADTDAMKQAKELMRHIRRG